MRTGFALLAVVMAVPLSGCSTSAATHQHPRSSQPSTTARTSAPPPLVVNFEHVGAHAYAQLKDVLVSLPGVAGITYYSTTDTLAVTYRATATSGNRSAVAREVGAVSHPARRKR